MTYIIPSDQIGGDESPSVGDQLESNFDNRDHFRNHAGYAYHLGATTSIKYDLEWANSSFSKSVGDVTLASQLMTIRLDEGRDNIGSYASDNPLQLRQTFELRLRGQATECLVIVRVVRAMDGEVQEHIGTFSLSCDSEFPQTEYFTVKDYSIDEVVQVWVDSVRAVDVDGDGKPEGTLHSLEVSPCRMGGQQPLNRSEFPAPVNDSAQSGMDAPDLGPDSIVCIGSRHPDHLADINQSLSNWDTPGPGDANENRWVDIGGGLTMSYDGPGTGGWVPSAEVNSPISIFAGDYIGTPLNFPFDATSDPYTVVTGGAFIIRGGKTITALEFTDHQSGLTASIVWDPGQGGNFIGVLNGGNDGTEILANYDSTSSEWVELMMTLTYHPDEPDRAKFGFYANHNRVFISTDLPIDGVLPYIGGSGTSGVSRMDDGIVAWPYAMGCPSSQVGAESNLHGYIRSWKGWRSLMMAHLA